MATARAAALPSAVVHILAELADPGLAILLRDVAGQEHQFAGLHERHVGRGGNGHRRQGDVEGLEVV
jgi:hypothetical protein